MSDPLNGSENMPVQDLIPDLIVVPARFGSTRLPGKPLLDIAGHTLLDRVVAIARRAAEQAGQCDVVVATDDSRIADHASALGVAVAMTSPDLSSGTMRAHAAAHQRPDLPPRVINLQGDAPFIPANIVADLLRALRQGSADVATPVFRLDWARLDRLRAHKRIAPFSGTTCIRADDGRALWFSKTILPAMRNEDNIRASALSDTALSPVWQHLGLYGYSLAALDWFAAAAPTPYEALEGLEQLRFIEHGRAIATVEVDVPAHVLSGIDTPEDLAMAERAIATFGDPYPV